MAEFFKGQFTTAQVGGGRGAEVECHRCEDRGAGVWGGGHRGSGLGRGLCLLPRKFFWILALSMVSLGAFWMVFFTVQLPVLHAKPV